MRRRDFENLEERIWKRENEGDDMRKNLKKTKRENTNHEENLERGKQESEILIIFQNSWVLLSMKVF